jgi:hypothetical protein
MTTISVPVYVKVRGTDACRHRSKAELDDAIKKKIAKKMTADLLKRLTRRDSRQ